MLPDRNTILQEDERMPSYTPKIDFERNRIMGTVDNIDAMEQAIYLILQTERYESNTIPADVARADFRRRHRESL